MWESTPIFPLAQGCAIGDNGAMSIQAETHPPEITVGDRCRRARLAAGYRKPRHLAAAAPISENTIRKYEIDDFGIRGPRPSTLNHWARACHVTVPWLLHGDPDD